MQPLSPGGMPSRGLVRTSDFRVPLPTNVGATGECKRQKRSQGYRETLCKLHGSTPSSLSVGESRFDHLPEPRPNGRVLTPRLGDMR
jgi:hypothetical protein